jgi:hypothetical protein
MVRPKIIEPTELRVVTKNPADKAPLGAKYVNLTDLKLAIRTEIQLSGISTCRPKSHKAKLGVNKNCCEICAGFKPHR